MSDLAEPIDTNLQLGVQHKPSLPGRIGSAVRVTSFATGHIKFYIAFHAKISHPFMHLPHFIALVVVALTGLCSLGLGFASIAALPSPPSRPFVIVTALCSPLSPLSPSFRHYTRLARLAVTGLHAFTNAMVVVVFLPLLSPPPPPPPYFR
jgi:hypothetical protein